MLQAALNIEDGIETLRYNKVIVATDADVDGMHIRLLIITFFLQFFPDLIKKDMYTSCKLRSSACATRRRQAIATLRRNV